MKNITPIFLPENTIQVKLCGNIINVPNLKNIEILVSDEVFDVYLNSNLALQADLEKGDRLKFNDFIKAIGNNEENELQSKVSNTIMSDCGGKLVFLSDFFVVGKSFSKAYVLVKSADIIDLDKIVSEIQSLISSK